MNVHIFPAVPSPHSRLHKVNWVTKKLSDSPKPVTFELERLESLQWAHMSWPGNLTLREGQAACQDFISTLRGSYDQIKELA